MLDAAPRCTSCHRAIPAWDLPRRACVGCQQHTSQRLDQLPDLYAQLDPRPGRSGSATGSRHAAAGSRPPIRLDVVDLTGRHGILVALTGWVRVWHEDGAGALPPWPAAETEQVSVCCRWLRWRLDWATRQHEAISDAIREIADAHRHVHSIVTGDRPPRRVTVACPCGGTMRVTLDTADVRCPACSTQYGHSEALSLPLAERRMAA